VTFWSVVGQIGAEWLLSKAQRSPKPKKQYTTIEEAMRAAGRTPVPATPAITEGGNYMASSFIIPPGGFAGFNQMTSASRAALTGGKTTRKRRKKRAKKAKRSKAASAIARKLGSGSIRRKSSRRKKLVKGSAAARKFMAGLRAKRK
jgi:hypothetical protein